MAIIHQQNGLDFSIEASFPEPPHVSIAKGIGRIVIRIGVPEKELPHIEKYENVAREDIDLAFNIVSDSQDKFLNAWRRIHSTPI